MSFFFRRKDDDGDAALDGGGRGLEEQGLSATASESESERACSHARRASVKKARRSDELLGKKKEK